MKFAMYIVGFLGLVMAAVGVRRYVKSFTYEDEERVIKAGNFLTIAFPVWMAFFVLLIIYAHDGLFWF